MKPACHRTASTYIDPEIPHFLLRSHGFFVNVHEKSVGQVLLHRPWPSIGSSFGSTLECCLFSHNNIVLHVCLMYYNNYKPAMRGLLRAILSFCFCLNLLISSCYPIIQLSISSLYQLLSNVSLLRVFIKLTADCKNEELSHVLFLIAKLLLC